MDTSLPTRFRWSCARRSVCVDGLMRFLPKRDFRACVEQYQRQSRPRGFFVSRSVLVAGVRSTHLSRKLARHRNESEGVRTELYHAGFRGKISRSTLADGNCAHDDASRDTSKAEEFLRAGDV